MSGEPFEEDEDQASERAQDAHELRVQLDEALQASEHVEEPPVEHVGTVGESGSGWEPSCSCLWVVDFQPTEAEAQALLDAHLAAVE